MPIAAGAIVVVLAIASELGLAPVVTPPPPASEAIGYYSVLIEKKIYKHFAFTSQEIARCAVVTSGLTCTIKKTASATRTIQLDFGASRSFVAGSLQISSAATQSVSVQCTSGKLKAGQVMVAYPVGTRYTYKLEKHMTSPPYDYVIGTSRLLTAFDPSPAGISCRVL